VAEDAGVVVQTPAEFEVGGGDGGFEGADEDFARKRFGAGLIGHEGGGFILEDEGLHGFEVAGGGGEAGHGVYSSPPSSLSE